VPAESDYVVAALPLDASTRGLLDGRRLGLMKPGGVPINVGRAATVDEEALYDALKLPFSMLDTSIRNPATDRSALGRAARSWSWKTCW